MLCACVVSQEDLHHCAGGPRTPGVWILAGPIVGGTLRDLGHNPTNVRVSLFGTALKSGWAPITVSPSSVAVLSNKEERPGSPIALPPLSTLPPRG